MDTLEGGRGFETAQTPLASCDLARLLRVGFAGTAPERTRWGFHELPTLRAGQAGVGHRQVRLCQGRVAVAGAGPGQWIRYPVGLHVEALGLPPQLLAWAAGTARACHLSPGPHM